jgi:hypothetical protein
MGTDQTAAQEIVTIAVQDAVGVVTLRVPALSRPAKEQLLAGVQKLSGDDAVRAVVLTGAVGTVRAIVIGFLSRLHRVQRGPARYC